EGEAGGAEAQTVSAETTEAASAEAPEPAPEPQPASFDAALAAEGEKVFKKCKSCHQVGDGAKNRSGPVLTDIVGAPVAAVENFKYSGALLAKAEEGVVWDDAALDAFLAKPRDWAKGTKMTFAGLRKEEDRQAVIEYLKSVKP
ncbi:MAG: c-type cytochrome, partial [Pseudomonadota bacterium]